MSRSLADFELELNLPRYLLREMALLGEDAMLPIGGEEVLILGILTRLGGWGWVGEAVLWTHGLRRFGVEASFSAVGY